eukprot:14071547-Alexandrium_andersonii.AAC.1
MHIDVTQAPGTMLVTCSTGGNAPSDGPSIPSTPHAGPGLRAGSRGPWAGSATSPRMETSSGTRAHGLAWPCRGGGLRAKSAALKTATRGAELSTEPGTLGAPTTGGATS